MCSSLSFLFPGLHLVVDVLSSGILLMWWVYLQPPPHEHIPSASFGAQRVECASTSFLVLTDT